MYGCNWIPYQTHALSDRNKQIYIGRVAIESLENKNYRKKDNIDTNNIRAIYKTIIFYSAYRNIKEMFRSFGWCSMYIY